MPSVFWIRFGEGNPQSYSGLAPTFLKFNSFTGPAVTAPGFTEPISGSGLYQFTITPSFSIAFIADAATTGIPNSLRYVAGSIDPTDMLDVRLAEQGTTLSAVGGTLAAIGSTLAAQGATLAAIGTTAIALGSTVSGIAATLSTLSTNFGDLGLRIGSTASSFGSGSSDPSDLFGYQKRVIELLEGNQVFSKETGAFTLYDRTGGTTLRSKTVSNDASGVTRS